MSDHERKRGRSWLRLAFAGLILVGVGSYLFGVVQIQVDLNLEPWASLPMAPLEVPEGLAERMSVPAQPGALRGHSLLLVTLDTTRPDRLGCYGNEAIQTPSLDRLAAGGILFSNAVATAATTLPAHASVMTGLYPHHHQARVNLEHLLSERALTLAEMLSAAGYRTGAFVSSAVLKAKFGLAQGFDRYDDGFWSPGSRFGQPERGAGETTDAAISWLRLESDRPFLAWVHYYDAHDPYSAPKEIAARFKHPYDAEIAYVDQELGRLVEFIDQEVPGEVLVVVIGDHGEALGEHGEVTHGYLAQEATIRIPLILHASSGLERGVHVPTRVSQIDLLPTLVSLLGIPVPEGLDGMDLTAGADPERALLTEAVYGHFQYGWAPFAGVYRGGAKYVQGPRPELYDLGADPLETKNLYEQRPLEARELAALLRRLRGSEADRVPESQVVLAPEELEQLRALGYVTTGVPLGAKADSGPDPKQMLPLANELLAIMGAVDRYKHLSTVDRVILRLTGRPVVPDQDALVAELEAFARAHPDFAPAYNRLEVMYRRLGREEAAARAHQRFTELKTKAGEG